jgi:ABC-type Co2+ transport system permease subunit
MNFMEGLTNPNWLVFALLFLAVLLYLVILRNREARRISEKFPREQIVLTSFGVNYFGLESEPGGPLRSTGALVLLKDSLYYRARFANRELTIPGAAITHIGVTDTHKGKPLHQYVVAIRFLNAEGKEEKAAFRIPLPAQWTAAIKATLIGGRALSPTVPPAEPGAGQVD